jgi:hypothetical protein
MDSWVLRPLPVVSGHECAPTTLAVSAYERPMKIPAAAGNGCGSAPSLYHDDALTDAHAEARLDVLARLGLALKHWAAAAE